MRAAADPTNPRDESEAAPPEPIPVAELPPDENGNGAPPAPIAVGPDRLVYAPPTPEGVPEPLLAIPVVTGWTRYSLWVLLVLTLLGGYLRFAFIDKPPLWTDESYTFRRVSGTYQELLDVLQFDGFGPLHYQLYWWLAHKAGGAWSDPALMTSADYAKQAVAMTPFWMRFFPSLLGTLMAPVMYFLARQMTSRRTSLLVAAFTACSAFMMVYSHDAKMYMMLWFFGALSAACLLWWFRTNRRIAWLAWIAATLGMGGTHASGFVLLAVMPIFLVTQRRMHWKKFVLFLLGMAVAAAGPGVHYKKFNKWIDRVEDDWSESGVTWATQVVAGRTGSDMLLYVASGYMFSWEWPRSDYDPDDPDNRSGRNTQTAFRQMLQGFSINPKVYIGLMTAVVSILALCALGALPWSRRLRGETLDDRPTQPWWRSTMWLAAWLIVPAYGMYCASQKGSGRAFAKPSEWVDSFGLLFNDRWILFSLIVVALFALCIWVRRFAAFLGVAAAVMLAVILFGSLVHVKFHRPLGVADAAGMHWKYWEYIEWWRILRIVGNRWYDALTHPYMIIAGLLLVPPLVWYYSAGTTWERLLRAFQLLLVVAGIYACCVGVYEYLLKNPPANESALWMPRWVGMVWPAFAIAMCALLMRLPTRPLRWIAVLLLLGVNTSQSLARMFWGTEPRLDMMYDEIKAGLPVTDDWPAPGGLHKRYVRGGKDWEAAVGPHFQAKESNFRVYIDSGSATSPHPAGANLGTNQAKYYAARARGESWSPGTYRNVSMTRYFTFHSATSPSAIAVDVRRSPQLNHIVVWERLAEREDPKEQLEKIRKAFHSVSAGIPYAVDGYTYPPSSATRLGAMVTALEKQVATPDPDPILAALGPGWKMVEPAQYHTVRYHWNWSELYVNRRREYKKAGATP